MTLIHRERVIAIGTRKSKLALAQTEMIRAALMSIHSGLQVSLELITTKGDVILDRPLSAIGDKGLFVSELEVAMRAGRTDLAVHSCKDLPSILPADMLIGAFPQRADPRDALIDRAGRRFADLPQGAHIGTSSLRRACQLRQWRPDLRISNLRGNVDTRLRRLHEGAFDAIVLAAAGLARLGLLDQVTDFLAPSVMLPAVAQGTLALEIRANDPAIASLLAPLDHAPTRTVTLAERAFLARLGGGCQVPVAAYAELDDHHQTMTINGMIGTHDGRVVRCGLSGPADQPELLGTQLAEQLLGDGGDALLHEMRA